MTGVRFFLLFALVGLSSSSCIVKEARSGEERECRFPFKFRGIEYTGCTRDSDPQDQLWCSTNTTSDGVHVAGHWGICPEGCPKHTNDITLSEPEDIGSHGMLKEEEKKHGDNSVNNNDRDLGTWKPHADKYECGITVLGDFSLLPFPKPGEFSFMVLLGYNISGSIRYVCAGTLINRHYVLTAAHCLTGGYEIKQLVFGEHIIGSLDRDCDAKEWKGDRKVSCFPPPQIRSPAPGGIKVHEKWDAENFKDGNDIALIRLDKPVDTLNKNLDNIEKTILFPICLPWDPKVRNANLTSDQEKVSAIGWGRVTNSRTKASKNYEEYSMTSRRLDKLRLMAETEENCLKDFPGLKPETQFCARDTRRGKHSCIGDSGGPLIYRNFNEGYSHDLKWYQVGIDSFGSLRCGKEKLPNVYTRVASYLDWIEQNMEP